MEDGGIIVLGGLISDDGLTESEAAGAVPRLDPDHRRAVQDPQRRSKTKTNLMVFIRPRILRDGIEAAIETNAKYNYMRDQQLDYATTARCR